MPYYVYQLSPTVANLIKPMEQLAEYETYKEARNFARNKRQEGTTDEGVTYKVIYADNTLDAEEKLTEFREQPILLEWEK
ncbi:MAG: hypothetical protein HQL46_10900 [Gammaproteobacteria bacterium]|nr:hypothetical protein [Gammaproteobacteria bacterium]